MRSRSTASLSQLLYGFEELPSVPEGIIAAILTYVRASEVGISIVPSYETTLDFQSSKRTVQLGAGEAGQGYVRQQGAGT